MLMPICTRCAERYGSSPVSGLCRQCISIPNPPEIPIVKDEEWNLAETKANQRLCAILGRIPKLAWYKNAALKSLVVTTLALIRANTNIFFARSFGPS